MNKETLTICKQKLFKHYYEGTSAVSRPVNQIVSQNAYAIYLLAEIVQALLKDKDKD